MAVTRPVDTARNRSEAAWQSQFVRQAAHRKGTFHRLYTAILQGLQLSCELAAGASVKLAGSSLGTFFTQLSICLHLGEAGICCGGSG